MALAISFRFEGEEIAPISNAEVVADALMQHSEGNNNNKRKKNKHDESMFACKTCNRKFATFQALGGHRASHKRLPHGSSDTFAAASTNKVWKTHKCSICEAEFSIGQALGGHMRKHTNNITNSSSGNIIDHHQKTKGTRCFCLNLFPDRQESREFELRPRL